MSRSIERELAEVRKRRAAALDALVQAFIDICNCDVRSDVLLDRLNMERDAEKPGRMT